MTQEEIEQLYKQRKTTLDIHISNMEQQVAKWDKYESWYLGNITHARDAYDGRPPSAAQLPSAEDFRHDANYTYAYLDTMVSVVAHQNPQLTINPQSKQVEEAAKARESLANDTFRRIRLAARERRMVLNTGIYGRSYSKTVWSVKHRRPTVVTLNPRCVFVDPTMPWDDIRYLIEAVPYTEREFRKKAMASKWKLKNDRWPAFDRIPDWIVDQTEVAAAFNQSVYDANKWIVVYEYYDFENDRLAIMLGDQEEPLWEGGLPYKFFKNPYDRTVFNENPRDEQGVSDIALIEPLQVQLNDLDAYQMWHTFMTIPIGVLNENGVDHPEDAVTSYRNATGPGDIARFKVREPYKIEDVFKFTQAPSSMPAFDSSRKRVAEEIQFLLGLPAYARGQAGASELATEMSLVDTATRNRNGARVAVMDQWIISVGMKVLGLWREFFPAEAELTLGGREMFSEVIVDRMSLAFGRVGEMPADESLFTEEWYYSYEVAASSPAESDKNAIVSRLVQFMPVFQQARNIDHAALISWMADLIGAKRIVLDKPAELPAAPQGGMPGVPGFSGSGPIPQGGEMAGEGADQAAEAAIPQGARQLASQPKIDMGAMPV